MCCLGSYCPSLCPVPSLICADLRISDSVCPVPPMFVGVDVRIWHLHLPLGYQLIHASPRTNFSECSTDNSGRVWSIPPCQILVMFTLTNCISSFPYHSCDFHARGSTVSCSLYNADCGEPPFLTPLVERFHVSIHLLKLPKFWPSLGWDKHKLSGTTSQHGSSAAGTPATMTDCWDE